jgi:pimeloyl-ACP methyl ester carboxylesterase
MEPPETRYASVGDAQVAYQVFGDGPDLVHVQGFTSNVDYRWDEPLQARFLKRLASFSRVIMFDRRGTGASDPLPAGGGSSWEDWVDDLNAVLKAVGSERTSLVASNDAGPTAMLYAATYPERVASLVLSNTAARATKGPDYPFGVAPELTDAFVDTFEAMWGKEDGAFVRLFAPLKADDPEFIRWMARLQRASMTPRRAAEMWRLILEFDARHVLPLVQAPTLVVGFRDSEVAALGNSEYLAEHIPDARLLVVSGGGTMTWLNEPDRILEAIEELVTGETHVAEPDRVLATVLLTDIVGSTVRASELGDRRWREVLDDHDRVSRRQVSRHGGRIIKTTGDGVLATFDGPARAVRAAADLSEELARTGIPIRSGLHAGEVELRGDDVGGIAIHIAARVMDLAQPGEVLVSSTVKGLVAGSGLAFQDRGTHRLRGIPDEWPLHALAR